MQVLRVVRDRERVRVDRGRELVARVDHHLRVDAELLVDRLLELALERRRRRAAREHDVAALHERLDVGVAEASISARRSGMLTRLARADVDAAQERDAVARSQPEDAPRVAVEEQLARLVVEPERVEVRRAPAPARSSGSWSRTGPCAGRRGSQVARRAPADSGARCRPRCRCRRSRACGRRRPSPRSTGSRCGRRRSRAPGSRSRPGRCRGSAGRSRTGAAGRCGRPGCRTARRARRTRRTAGSSGGRSAAPPTATG